MTDPLEAARAYVAAGDALKSPEHAADVEKLRELSNRVREREAALEAAQAALFGEHQRQVEEGEAEPAPNEEAARTIRNFRGDDEGLHYEGKLPPEAAKTIGGKPWVEQFLNGDHPALSASESDDVLFEMEDAEGDDTDEPTDPTIRSRQYTDYLTDTFQPPANGLDVPEEATARANGAYSED